MKFKTNPATKIKISRYPEREATLWIAAYWGDEFLVDISLTLGVDYDN